MPTDNLPKIPETYAGGGGGTGSSGGWGGGGYPSWWYDTWDFVNWLRSIRIYEGEEPIFISEEAA